MISCLLGQKWHFVEDFQRYNLERAEGDATLAEEGLRKASSVANEFEAGRGWSSGICYYQLADPYHQRHHAFMFYKHASCMVQISGKIHAYHVPNIIMKNGDAVSGVSHCCASPLREDLFKTRLSQFFLHAGKKNMFGNQRVFRHLHIQVCTSKIIQAPWYAVITTDTSKLWTRHSHEPPSASEAAREAAKLRDPFRRRFTAAWCYAEVPALTLSTTLAQSVSLRSVRSSS